MIYSLYRYLLQPIAIEIFSSDGRNYLLAFPKAKERNKVYQRWGFILAVKIAVLGALFLAVAVWKCRFHVRDFFHYISTNKQIYATIIKN